LRGAIRHARLCFVALVAGIVHAPDLLAEAVSMDVRFEVRRIHVARRSRVERRV
jgi:hypothetical protein